MKKLLWFVPLIFLLSACNAESEENYTQMLGAYERHNSELNTQLDDAIETINNSSNRESALKSINENILPKIDDFRQTLNNYTLTSNTHLEIREAMMTYLDELQRLMEMYSDFNTEFYLVNPLSDESIDEELDSSLEDLKAQEETMKNAKAEADKLIGDNSEE